MTEEITVLQKLDVIGDVLSRLSGLKCPSEKRVKLVEALEEYALELVKECEESSESKVVYVPIRPGRAAPWKECCVAQRVPYAWGRGF